MSHQFHSATIKIMKSDIFLINYAQKLRKVVDEEEEIQGEARGKIRVLENMQDDTTVKLFFLKK